MCSYDKIPTQNLSHEEWLALRKTGIGGSDAGAICGLNPYSSAIRVFQDKVNEKTESIDNESMRQGRDLEEYVARRFTEETGLKVRRSNQMYRSKDYPFMIADVDRLIVGEDAGLECKTASSYGADKWKNGAIPDYYLIQCYHYMAVTGKSTWYLAVVILGREFQYRKITWDDGLISNLISIEKNFWEEHVMKGIIPAPDGSDVCDEILNQYFRVAQKDSAIQLQGFEDRLKRREEVLKLMDKLEKEQKQIEQEIKLYMKDCEYAFCDTYKVSWSNVDTARIDAKRLKEEEPELYRKFLKVNTARRFSVKVA